MPVKAILFDKDGTLFDFQATWAQPFLDLLDRIPTDVQRKDAAEQLGFDPVGMRFHPDSLVIAGTIDEVSDVLAPILGADLQSTTDLLNEVGAKAYQVPAVPLRPCLDALRKNHVLGLVTNDAEAPARGHLEQEGILDVFSFVAGYDSGFGAKPAPGPLLAFSKAFGVLPANTLMVGDSRHDLRAGRAAGMGTVGVLTGVASADDLQDLADVVLPDIGHLLRWIEGQTD